MGKRILIGIAVVFGLIVVALGGGVTWLLHKTQQHLTPPPDPSGQHSIARYAEQASVPEAAFAPVLVGDFSWETLAEPPKSARPWTRWWWPGGDVDAVTAVAQLDQLDAAGFGGMEVQPFLSGMMGIEPAVMEQVYRFDSPGYFETLKATLAAAAEQGLQIDLTHFSGWPPGGPEVNLEDSLTILAHGETLVSGKAGGGEVSVALPQPKPGPSEYIFSIMEFAGADFINFPVEHARLLSVVAARRSEGKHARNPFNLADTETLAADSLQVITNQVQDGVLRWQAPPGEWRIIASYLMPSGEVPMGAAQKPQGFVVDHLRRPQVIGHYEYAFGQRTGLPAFYGKGLRGFFNDSLEFRLKRMAVEDILAEFKARRGYDLEPYLPAIYVEGIDNVYFSEILHVRAAPEFHITPLDDRIRRDYQRTLSDLVIERFVEASAEWAGRRGLVSRGQSYGMDIDILRALGANTIPETEQLWAGGADAGLKMASSAAALYGRPLVSAESFVWINRDYSNTARKIKAAADKLLLAGINHIVYHGTPYPWRGGEAGPFGEEGWAPFSGPENPAHFSSNVGPGNTALWPDVPALNTYIARSQNLLRQGRPAIDVLIYYPFLGFHGSNPEGSGEALVNGSLPDADPKRVNREDPTLTAGKRQLDRVLTVPPEQLDERVAWVRELQPLLQALDRRGISWGWVNDHALQNGLVEPGVLTASGGSYRAVLLPNVDRIEAATLTKLQQLAGAGVPVLLAGRHPSQQPGFNDAEQGDRAVQQGVQALLTQGARALDKDGAALIEALPPLPNAEIQYEGDSAIRRMRRSLPEGGGIHFFGNQNAEAARVSLKVPIGKPLWWFDAIEGVAWPAQPEAARLELALSGFESRFLIVGLPQPANVAHRQPAGLAFQAAQRRWPLAEWIFKADAFSAEWQALPDWRDIEALRHARAGRYTHRFTLDDKRDGARYLLNLGLVQGSAAVSVNGQSVGRASLPPFALDITAALQPGENRIDIEVLAPLRNDFVGRALAKDPRYSHMERYRDELVAAGLVGPVVIAEVAAEQQ